MSERIAPLSAILAQVPDPRKPRGRQYPWLPLLVVVGLLCGATHNMPWRAGATTLVQFGGDASASWAGVVPVSFGAPPEHWRGGRRVWPPLFIGLVLRRGLARNQP
jgi:hypothetical protein